MLQKYFISGESRAKRAHYAQICRQLENGCVPICCASNWRETAYNQAMLYQKRKDSAVPLAVVGAGVVGRVAALALKRAGQTVRLFEVNGAPIPAGVPRLYALSASSRELLESLGVWAALRSPSPVPMRRMQLYGDQGGTLQIAAWQAGVSALAWMVPEDQLLQALTTACFNQGLVPEAAEVLAPESAGERPRLLVAGTPLAAELLIAADGARSPLRELTEVPVQRHAYGQRGLVGLLHLTQSHGGAAWQWFREGAVLGILPAATQAGRPAASVVWSLPQQQAEQFEADPELALQTMRQWLADSPDAPQISAWASALASFPLALQQTKVSPVPGLLLIGDAAHTVHPLAGQGLNLGLGDVTDLVDVLANRPSPCRVSDPWLLDRYARRRALPLTLVRQVTHGLHGLFGQEDALVRLGRNRGINLLDRLPGLKALMVGGAART